MIAYLDEPGGNVKYAGREALRNDAWGHNEAFDHQGVTCRITFNPFTGAYCGYIEDALDGEIYEVAVHGDWTAGQGFDCAHFGSLDLSLRNDMFLTHTACGRTFKPAAFVRAELKRVLDAYEQVKEMCSDNDDE